MSRPLRIVLVANFNYRGHGERFNASVDVKIGNGLIRAGHAVVPFSYRDVARSETPFGSKRFGLSRMNRRLIEACENVEPELLCLGHSESIRPETLARIRERFPKMKLCLWYHDALWDTHKLAHIHDRLPYLDTVLVSTGGEKMRQFKTAENRVAYFPPPVDPSIERHRNFARSDLPIDLLFCGRVGGAKERENFMRDLRDRLEGMNFDLNGPFGTPLVFGARYDRKLSSSRMGLNFSRQNDHYMCSSGRLSQLVGNGLLTFSPRVPGMDRLLAEDEIVYFDGLDDLVGKALRFHADDAARRRVAEAGWKRAHATLDCRRVCRYMVETVMGETHSEPYEWGDQVI